MCTWGQENLPPSAVPTHDAETLTDCVLGAYASVNKRVGKESFQIILADGYSSIILFRFKKSIMVPHLL